MKSRLLRFLLLLKVMVMLSLGTATAWAECEDHDSQAFNGQVGHSGLMLAKSESEPGDQGQGGSADDDDSTNLFFYKFKSLITIVHRDAKLLHR